MSGQTTLNHDHSESSEDNTASNHTQIYISDLSVLAERTDAIIDRSSEPYIEGNYKNATPLQYVKPIGEILGGFDLDPCASPESVIAETNIRNTGGKLYDWSLHDKIWCNPPYKEGEKIDWLQKAVDTSAETVVMLLPANVNANWFQKYAPKASLIAYLDERIKFHGDGTPSSGPVYLVYGEYPDELRQYFESNGHVQINTQSNNTINVQPSPSDLRLDDIGVNDELRLHFDDLPAEYTRENLDTISVFPVTEYLAATPDDKWPLNSGIIKQSDLPNSKYLELTCIHQKANSAKEDFIVIYQSVSNPQAIYVFIHHDQSWSHHNVDKIEITTKTEKTISSLPTAVV